MGTRPFNQPGVVNGTLFLGGNAIHEIWNVSSPTAPVRMAELISPHSNGEAESHQISFASFEDGSLHAVTISGRGIDLWNISNPAAPVLESSLQLQGINYGDFTEAVWGVFWQGHTIFAGGTNTGLHVIDASDPAAPRLIRRIGMTTLGGVSAGPLFALGNLLVVTTPKENAGIVTIDIGAPADPLFLDAEIGGPDSYIGGFFGVHAHLVSPFRSYDVLSDPTNIRLAGSAETPASEYMSFADGNLLLGSLRRTAGGITGIIEYRLSDLNNLTQIAHIQGRDFLSDDQFSIAIGNLLVVADEERGYGAYLAVRNTARDTTPPSVIAVNPPAGATEQPLTTRIGLSFSDVIELTSASTAAVTLRPISGGPGVRGRFGLSGTVLAFSPSEPLLPETTYELVVAAGGLSDFVGNKVSAEFRSTFTTGRAGGNTLPCEIAAPRPVAAGAPAVLTAAAATPATHTYEWNFGDGASGLGDSATHTYSAPGRHSVSLTVVEKPSASTRFDLYEAEDATLSGGVRDASDNAGYSGAGYADFPTITAGGPRVIWSDVRAVRSGSHEMVVRYANGDAATRQLELVVNGASASTVLSFPATGAWTTWSETRVPLILNGGLNTIELRASGAGPNIDRLEVSVIRSGSCSAIQIVHRPLSPDVPSRSSPIAIAGDRVWVVNPDHGSIAVLDPSMPGPLSEISTGARPRSVARAPDGKMWVTTEDGVKIIAGDAVEATINLPPASLPYGLVFGADKAYVALEALGRVVAIDLASRTVSGSLDLNGPVRGLAIHGRRLFATRFVSPADRGEIYEIDPTSMSLMQTISLAESTLPDTPDQGRGIPNYLSSMTINPDGTELWLPSKQDNIRRGKGRDGEALTHDGTVRPIVSQVDLATGRETLSRRMDLNDAALPFAVEMSPLGDLLFIAVQGSNKIEVRESYTGRIAGSISVGRAPEGLVLSGDRLYVHNFLDRTVTIADVSGFLSARDNVGTTVATLSTAEREILPANILRGKQLFYDASDRRLAKEGYISCAACHLDGKEDGRVWDFTDRGEGFRNTISLEGRAGVGHGRVHWSANFDEIQDFEHDIRAAFGGSGLMSDEDFNSGTRNDALGDAKAGISADLDALAAYVSTLARVPNSPHRAADGSLTPEARAGLALFFRADCDSCHPPPLFTDLQLHDVGTLKATSGQRRHEALTGIDTPTLLGVFATPPYFHDGSAATLDAVLDVHAPGLDAREKTQLANYLRQLDEREKTAVEPRPDPIEQPEMPTPMTPEAPVADRGCDCASTQGGEASLWILLLALVLRRRR